MHASKLVVGAASPRSEVHGPEARIEFRRVASRCVASCWLGACMRAGPRHLRHLYRTVMEALDKQKPKGPHWCFDQQAPAFGRVALLFPGLQNPGKDGVSEIHYMQLVVQSFSFIKQQSSGIVDATPVYNRAEFNRRRMSSLDDAVISVLLSFVACGADRRRSALCQDRWIRTIKEVGNFGNLEVAVVIVIVIVIDIGKAVETEPGNIILPSLLSGLLW
mmetsp:Transcript_26592/g.62194  ORF Transcript_26592/g.62194 Transcript_26592/m.62194 type:complete len:219 (-) Transcript_26592:62-718(-)